MNRTSNWAPVVYSRTHHVDFRFLAVPEDAMDASASEQILDGIRPMLGAVTDLRARPTWAVFTTATHCIFGVAAYVSDIAGRPLEPDITYVGVRQNYAFAGWAAKLAEPVNLPLYDQLDMAHARPLLMAVQAHWEEQDYDRKVDATPYETQFAVDDHAAGEEWSVDAAGLTISPLSRSGELWDAAARALRQSQRNISLCIDLPHAHEAYASTYGHVTARDAREVRVHPKAQPERSTETANRWKTPRSEHPAFDHGPADARSGSSIGNGALIAAVLAACVLAVWQRWLLLLLALAGGAWFLGRDDGAQAPTLDDSEDPLVKRRKAARAKPRRGTSAWD